MPSQGWLAIVPLTAIFIAAACGTDPGTSGPGQNNNSAATTGGSGEGGGSGGAGGSGSGGGAGTAGGGQDDCNSTCGPGFTCCDGECVNAANDIFNCGSCGTVCDGETPFCNGTECAPTPCTTEEPPVCTGGVCCGESCCAAGQICCDINSGGPSTGPRCVTPVDGTCPVGCPTCN